MDHSDGGRDGGGERGGGGGGRELVSSSSDSGSSGELGRIPSLIAALRNRQLDAPHHPPLHQGYPSPTSREVPEVSSPSTSDLAPQSLSQSQTSQLSSVDPQPGPSGLGPGGMADTPARAGVDVSLVDRAVFPEQLQADRAEVGVQGWVGGVSGLGGRGFTS